MSNPAGRDDVARHPVLYWWSGRSWSILAVALMHILWGVIMLARTADGGGYWAVYTRLGGLNVWGVVLIASSIMAAVSVGIRKSPVLLVAMVAPLHFAIMLRMVAALSSASGAAALLGIASLDVPLLVALTGVVVDRLRRITWTG